MVFVRPGTASSLLAYLSIGVAHSTSHFDRRCPYCRGARRQGVRGRYHVVLCDALKFSGCCRRRCVTRDLCAECIDAHRKSPASIQGRQVRRNHRSFCVTAAPSTVSTRKRPASSAAVASIHDAFSVCKSLLCKAAAYCG